MAKNKVTEETSQIDISDIKAAARANIEQVENVITQELRPQPCEGITETRLGMLHKPKVSEELKERMQEAKETLESFEDLRLPKIGFKDGFTLAEGSEPVDEFTGIIVYTKETNVYYKGRYKAGQNEQPDCFSPDGKVPTTEKPQAPTCKVCPHNQYGSAPGGDGKACKNTRPVYFLVDGGIIPKVLRVPPTSLGMVKQYMLNVAADYGSYMAVKTRVSIYRKVESQEHWNIKLEPAGKVSEQEKVDVKCVRDTWLNLMKEQTFIDAPEDVQTTSVPQDSDTVETSF